MQKEFTCIVCPSSCRITVTDDGGSLSTIGNTCERGREYACNEYLDPQRILTTTVVIENGVKNRLPVITEKEIPKTALRQCIQKLYEVRAKAPVKEGDVIAENICNTGVNVIASRSMEAKNE